MTQNYFNVSLRHRQVVNLGNSVYAFAFVFVLLLVFVCVCVCVCTRAYVSTNNNFLGCSGSNYVFPVRNTKRHVKSNLFKCYKKIKSPSFSTTAAQWKVKFSISHLKKFGLFPSKKFESPFSTFCWWIFCNIKNVPVIEANKIWWFRRM